MLEATMLKLREGTCVLWLIFPGNDLDEPYYPELENPRLVSPGPLTRLVNGFSDFRSRSPVRRLLIRGDSRFVVERKFVDARRMLFYSPYAQRRTNFLHFWRRKYQNTNCRNCRNEREREKN